MATNLIATGSTAATSADFDVAAGSAVTIGVKDALRLAHVEIEKKDDGGGYNRVATLSQVFAATVLSGAGTYRARRIPGSEATCGVYRD